MQPGMQRLSSDVHWGMRRAWLVVALCAGCGSLSPPAPAIGAPRWAVALGDVGTDRALDVAVDADGNVIVVGGHHDPLAPNEPGGPAPWPIAGFITKLSASDGATVWQANLRGVGANGAVVPIALALDTTGAAYVTGYYVGTADFGGQELSNPTLSGDSFLAKYTPDGQLVWVHGLSSVVGSAATAIRIDSAGHAVVLGYFTSGTLTLAGTAYTAPSQIENGYVAAFDSDGAVIWGHGFTSAGETRPSALATTTNGSILATGTFGDATSFGDIMVAPPGDSAFVTRIDPSGAMLEARAVDAAGATTSGGQSIAVSSTDVVFVQTIEDGHSVYAVPTLHALDLAWQEQWATYEPEEGDTKPPWPRALTVLPNGTAIAAAWVDSPFNADHPDTVTGFTSVVAYDFAGTPREFRIGSRSLGYVVESHVNAAAATAENGLVLAGEFGGAIDVGRGPLRAQGDLDGFVVMLDPPK